jgi:hypothetical protein
MVQTFATRLPLGDCKIFTLEMAQLTVIEAINSLHVVGASTKHLFDVIW